MRASCERLKSCTYNNKKYMMFWCVEQKEAHPSALLAVCHQVIALVRNWQHQLWHDAVFPRPATGETLANRDKAVPQHQYLRGTCLVALVGKEDNCFPRQFSKLLSRTRKGLTQSRVQWSFIPRRWLATYCSSSRRQINFVTLPSSNLQMNVLWPGNRFSGESLLCSIARNFEVSASMNGEFNSTNDILDADRER